MANKVFNTDKRIKLGVWGLGRGGDLIACCKALNIDVVAGCDFNHNFHGRTGFEYPNCAWDPSAYWQDWATIQVAYSPRPAARRIL